MLARDELLASSNQRPLSRSTSSSSFEMVEAEAPGSNSWPGYDCSGPPSHGCSLSPSRTSSRMSDERPDPQLNHLGRASSITPDWLRTPPSHSSPADQAAVAAEVTATVDAAVAILRHGAGTNADRPNIDTRPTLSPPPWLGVVLGALVVMLACFLPALVVPASPGSRSTRATTAGTENEVTAWRQEP